MKDDIAVKIEGVYKDFKLPHEKNNSIKSLVTGFYKKRNKGFEVQHALKDISFEVKKGEFFGIVGRNGSGKSTLLKIIAEIYRPTKGKVFKSGKLVPFIELGVGFNPELTGRENVFLNGALLGFSHEEVDAMYDEIVEFAELEKFMDQKLKNYSSGMQVRLAFSVATRAKADILLIDEVLAVGDADFQRKCFEYFKKLKKDKKTVIFVSHDMGAVREYCDKVVLLDKSRVISEGDAEKVAKEYTQLFVDTNSRVTPPEGKSKRWGNMMAVFNRPQAKVSDNGRNIEVMVEVSSSSSIADPTYGLMISNEAGQPILGTNSSILKMNTASLKPEDKVLLHWEFPNIFNEGKYYVELVLMYESITVVADWWEEAVSFSIANDLKTPYIVNPQTSLREEVLHG